MSSQNKSKEQLQKVASFNQVAEVSLDNASTDDPLANSFINKMKAILSKDILDSNCIWELFSEFESLIDTKLFLSFFHKLCSHAGGQGAFYRDIWNYDRALVSEYRFPIDFLVKKNHTKAAMILLDALVTLALIRGKKHLCIESYSAMKAIYITEGDRIHTAIRNNNIELLNFFIKDLNNDDIDKVLTAICHGDKSAISLSLKSSNQKTIDWMKSTIDALPSQENKIAISRQLYNHLTKSNMPCIQNDNYKLDRISLHPFKENILCLAVSDESDQLVKDDSILLSHVIPKLKMIFSNSNFHVSDKVGDIPYGAFGSIPVVSIEGNSSKKFEDSNDSILLVEKMVIENDVVRYSQRLFVNSIKDNTGDEEKEKEGAKYFNNVTFVKSIDARIGLSNLINWLDALLGVFAGFENATLENHQFVLEAIGTDRLKGIINREDAGNAESIFQLLEELKKTGGDKVLFQLLGNEFVFKTLFIHFSEDEQLMFMKSLDRKALGDFLELIIKEEKFKWNAFSPKVSDTIIKLVLEGGLITSAKMLADLPRKFYFKDTLFVLKKMGSAGSLKTLICSGNDLANIVMAYDRYKSKIRQRAYPSSIARDASSSEKCVAYLFDIFKNDLTSLVVDHADFISIFEILTTQQAHEWYIIAGIDFFVGQIQTAKNLEMITKKFKEFCYDKYTCQTKLRENSEIIKKIEAGRLVALFESHEYGFNNLNKCLANLDSAGKEYVLLTLGSEKLTKLFMQLLNKKPVHFYGFCKKTFKLFLSQVGMGNLRVGISSIKTIASFSLAIGREKAVNDRRAILLDYIGKDHVLSLIKSISDLADLAELLPCDELATLLLDDLQDDFWKAVKLDVECCRFDLESRSPFKRDQKLFILRKLRQYNKIDKSFFRFFDYKFEGYYSCSQPIEHENEYLIQFLDIVGDNILHELFCDIERLNKYLAPGTRYDYVCDVKEVKLIILKRLGIDYIRSLITNEIELSSLELGLASINDSHYPRQYQDPRRDPLYYIRRMLKSHQLKVQLKLTSCLHNGRGEFKNKNRLSKSYLEKMIATIFSPVDKLNILETLFNVIHKKTTDPEDDSFARKNDNYFLFWKDVRDDDVVISGTSQSYITYLQQLYAAIVKAHGNDQSVKQLSENSKLIDFNPSYYKEDMKKKTEARTSINEFYRK